MEITEQRDQTQAFDLYVNCYQKQLLQKGTEN
jgi:hypothetical protein